MKRLIALSVVWFLWQAMYSQLLFPEVYGTYGGYFKNSQVEIAYTSGEPLYETIVNQNSMLNQGFNQALIVIKITALPELALDYTVNVFPNPVCDFLNISFSETENRNLKMEFTDVQGRTIMVQPVFSSSEKIDISSFTRGIYLLKISDGTKPVHTFKIVKVQ